MCPFLKANFGLLMNTPPYLGVANILGKKMTDEKNLCNYIHKVISRLSAVDSLKLHCGIFYPFCPKIDDLILVPLLQFCSDSINFE